MLIQTQSAVLPAKRIRAAALVAVLFCGAPGLALAQDTHSASGGIPVGERLFLTSCGLCHQAPDLINKAPAPALSKATLNGDAGDIAQFIKTGTDTMPSFKYTYSDAEIDAIAHYIITLPAPGAAK